MLLTLIRHGQTDWNLARRIQGETDIPLNDTGREQARQAARVLAETMPDAGGAVVVASDLSRAAETAHILAAELGAPAPAAFYPELRERRYGEAEGGYIDEVTARYGDDGRDSVPGVETRARLRVRAVAALELVAASHAAAAGPVIAVSHGGVISELVRHASDDAFPRPGERIANGSAYVFEIEDGGIRLQEYAGVLV
ncbi:histidine phosphatase family protein [Microbacterium sp. LRZ72]|uniref:histidine phosphatase family protein n=1 Tax=Microbacterium sp. LRZ72 TaxID=2942481 RepID=UPI0029A75973|nr:histidine phosphatase family protein [Microbacterium sp. LRZ72]MDX2375293.1 histidine phosphatase family protein [Microbacterium sp. LRZ72]